MSLQDRWDGLSPTLRRGLVLGGAVAVLLALAALLVSAPEDERAGRGDERRRLITNLLTDADPRAIGIEGLAERLRRLENHTDQLNASLEKLGLGKGVDPERDAIIEGLRRENARQLAGAAPAAGGPARGAGGGEHRRPRCRPPRSASRRPRRRRRRRRVRHASRGP